MKRRKIMSLLLAAAMALSLAGCAGQASRDPDPALDAPQPMEEYEKARKTDLDQLRHEGAGSGQASPEAGKQQGGDPGKLPVGPAGQPAVPGGTDVNPIAFEDYLQASLQAGEWAGKSYMASPASFRAALCLLIEGAGGDTLDGLLKAAWFGSVDDARAWYARLLEHQASFREQAEAIDGMAARYMEDFGEGDLGVSVDVEGGGSGSGMAFDIANGIWDNLDKPGSFTKAYADSVSGRYGAAAKSSKAGDITKDVNGWCDEATNGMIPSISDDLSGSSSVLANALYIKSAWLDDFYEGLTEEGDFTKRDGSVSRMDFMHKTDSFFYVEDPAGRRYAAIGLEGGIYLTVCLDPDARVQEMYSAQYSMEHERLDLSMPKLDLETTFDNKEFEDYLKSAGAGLAFTDEADFKAMCADAPWNVDDIIQKTRLKTDEDGLEAAAVTAIMMETSCAFPEPEPDPIEFHMDRPFAFMITSGLHKNGWEGGCEILFFGRFEG